MENRVHFLGKLEKNTICRYLSDSDAFVLASQAETFRVVYTEALAMGLLVISTRCGGVDDFMTDKCGITIPVDDLNALVNAMNKLQLSIKTYNSVYIRNYIEYRFSSQYIALQIEKYLMELVNERFN